MFHPRCFLSPRTHRRAVPAPPEQGPTPIPRRRAVERTYGRLMLCRRLARDYETLPTRSEAMIHLAMTGLMARRLTGEAAISWRDPTPQTKQQIPGQNTGRKRPLGNDGPQGGIEIGEEQPRRLQARSGLRHVHEARVVALEGHRDRRRRTVTVLGHDQVGLAGTGDSFSYASSRCSRITMSASCSMDPDSRRSETIGFLSVRCSGPRFS